MMILIDNNREKIINLVIQYYNDEFKQNLSKNKVVTSYGINPKILCECIEDRLKEEPQKRDQRSIEVIAETAKIDKQIKKIMLQKLIMYSIVLFFTIASLISVSMFFTNNTFNIYFKIGAVLTSLGCTVLTIFYVKDDKFKINDRSNEYFSKKIYYSIYSEAIKKSCSVSNE